MTTLWLTLWMRWIVGFVEPGRPAPVPSPPLMMVLILGGAFATRGALRNNQPVTEARKTIVIGGGLAVIATLWISFGSRFPFGYFGNLFNWGTSLVPPELLVLIAAVFLWWRGITVGRDDDMHAAAERVFYNGIVALGLLVIIDNLHPSLSLDNALWPILFYFAIGLGALALAGVEQDRLIQKKADGSAFGLNRYWLATAAGVIGLVILAGLAVAALIAPETFNLVVAIFGPIVNLLALGLLSLFAAMTYVTYLLFGPLLGILHDLLWQVLQRFNLDQPSDPDQFSAGEAVEVIMNLPLIKAATHTLAILLIVLIVALVFWLAVRRLLLLTHQNALEETRESIFSGDLLLRQLKSLFARKGKPPLPGPPYLSLAGPRDDPRLIVRRAYQSMLDWAKTTGHPRSPKQTPILYADALTQSAPQHGDAIATLTRVYLTARYAADAPSLEDARQAEAAAAELRQYANPQR